LFQAAKEGVAGVEIDLQFTADGVGILLHDDTLERTTNGKGDVRMMTYSEITTLDAAAKHKNR
jgi:glycerophosphoinositol glycerophosphodiesterase